MGSVTLDSSISLKESPFIGLRSYHHKMASTVPIENSGQVGILAASAISIFIVFLFVGLRLMAKKLGRDWTTVTTVS